MYARARKGEIKEFTGISSPYEIPDNPELFVDTTAPLEACVQEVLTYLKETGVLVNADLSMNSVGEKNP